MAKPNASKDLSDLVKSVVKPYCLWFFGSLDRGVDRGKWDQPVKEGCITKDIPINIYVRWQFTT